MRIDTDEGLAAALRQIATWYETDPDQTSEAGVAPLAEIGSPGPGTSRRWPRLALVAALVLATAGVAAAVVVPSRVTPTDGIDVLDRSTVESECLDVDTSYDLDPLRSGGTLHILGGPSVDAVPVVLSEGSLHVACAVARAHDQRWRGIVSLAGSHLPLATTDDVTVEVAVTVAGHDGGTVVMGQAGPDIATIEVEASDGRHRALIDNGWWATSIEVPEDPGVAFPAFVVRWTTTAGSTGEAPGLDLLPPEPWRLCSQDAACRDRRLIELGQLAAGVDPNGQAVILADGVVTADEYRSALRAWGDCIADATGVAVTFDDDGRFTIGGSGLQIDAAFERCKADRIALVLEAAALAGATGDG